MPCTLRHLQMKVLYNMAISLPAETRTSLKQITAVEKKKVQRHPICLKETPFKSNNNNNNISYSFPDGIEMQSSLSLPSETEEIIVLKYSSLFFPRVQITQSILCGNSSGPRNW